MCLALTTALKMTKLFPISTPFLQPLVKEEIENLTASSSISGTKLALISAGASAYERWNLTSTPVPTRLQRLQYVPAGWRMNALSGSQFWMASLIGQPAPVRAWLIDLYSYAAALGWDATTKLESSLDSPVPALPFAFQALALNNLINSIKNSTYNLPYGLKQALPIALEGFLEGIADRLWERTISQCAGPATPKCYDALVAIWNTKEQSPIEPMGYNCKSDIIMVSNAEIGELVTKSLRIGELYAKHASSKQEESLMRNEPLVFSGIFSGF